MVTMDLHSEPIGGHYHTGDCIRACVDRKALQRA